MRFRASLVLLAILSAACALPEGEDDGSSEADLTKRKVDVIFSPQAAEASHLARIAKEITTAKHTIDVAIYSYSDPNVAKALADAVGRGVKVRMIFNDAGDDQRIADLAARAASKTGKIEATGVDVRYVNKIMHHKFMIIDGPRDVAARAKTARLVTGSANWSSSAATRFDENTLFVANDPELTARFQREFDGMWEHTRDFVGRQPALAEAPASFHFQDSQIKDDPNEHVFFTSQNFDVHDTTFTSRDQNTVADALVAGIEGATTSIHLASGHLRSRPVAEALIAKKKANPALDVRVYVDGQEYISQATHAKQVADLEACLAAATTPAKKSGCTDNGFLFGYQVASEGGIDVRYKYYAYRWDNAYAPQMHNKYMIVDGKDLYTGSYNLSDNAEHDTFENMTYWTGAQNASLVGAYEAAFERIWNTGHDEGRLDALLQQVASGATFPLVFEPMALTHAEITDLKQKIRAACPDADSLAFRRQPGQHQACTR